MRRFALGRFSRVRLGRNLIREIVGGALAILGAALVLLTIPGWLWKLMLGAGLVWLGIQLCWGLDN